MALFKILKGNKSTLPTTKNEGYMYITKDTGDIYVDMSASERLQLNADKAYRLRDNNDNLISVGNSSKPVYFSEGIPVEADAISWNNLADRPFYIETTIIYSGSVSADDYWTPMSQEIVPDFPHKIIFNNVEYTLIPQVIDDGEIGALFLGNGYLEFPEQFEDSGEDFCLRITFDYLSEFHLTTRDGSNSANLTIFGADQNNKLLLSRAYLNGSLPINGVGYSSEVFNNGASTQATGEYSHAEGLDTTATELASHAEGYYSHANGRASHAEGQYNYANGDYSHAEGENSYANSYRSHAEGYNTIASSQNQHVQGQYNIEDTEDKYAHIVGNGDNKKRSNAHTLDWDGNAWFAGDVYVGGTSQDEGSKLVTMADLEDNSSSSNYTYGTEDLEAGVSPLENGKLYFVYE